MHDATRALFDAYLENQAELNGTSFTNLQLGRQFAIVPTIQQVLIDRLGESSAFLGAINHVPVDEMKGEKLGLSVSSPIAGRSNTAAGHVRQTTDPSGLDQEGYECVQTDSDTHLTYAKLDMWAKFPDFETRIRNQILEQQRRDKIMIGWNGTSNALPAQRTNKVASPLLQDVNIGWLEHIRNFNTGANVFDEGEAEAGKIIIEPGVNGDFANVDALVTAAIFEFLPSWSRADTELVVILGDQLLHDIYFPLINKDQPATEKIATDLILSAKRIAGRQPVQVPFFPSDSILVTPLSNLSIYEQSGKRRRTLKEVPELSRIETYESSNDAYVVEDYDPVVLIENVQFGAT